MQTNTKKLTREFCLTHNLLFMPQTEKESIAIQQNLLDMGFVWTDGKDKPRPDKDCIHQGIVLLDRTLYTRASGDTRDYFLCNLEQFEFQITERFCKENNFCFHPASLAEAEFIERSLRNFGCLYRGGETDSLAYKYLDGTLNVQKGVMSFYPSSRQNDYRLLSAADFANYAAFSKISPAASGLVTQKDMDQAIASLTAAFNSRIKALEEQMQEMQKPAIIEVRKEDVFLKKPGHK